MVIIGSGCQVIGKNYREGKNENGPWEIFELEVSNGEGFSVRLNTTQEIYDQVETFKPYTMKINLSMAGYRIRADVQEVWPE